MHYFKKMPSVAMALGLPLLLFSCQKNLVEKEPALDKTGLNQTQMLVATADLPGRTLAANCFQCHGTNGYASELKIANMGVSEITMKFAQFKAESPRSNIMNLHAYAYTAEEIQLIADYFSKQ